MKIATEEIRIVAVKAYLSGIAGRQRLADIFGYHVGSTGGWIRESQRERRLSPLPGGHRISVFSAGERIQLAGYIEKNPDAALNEIRERFGKECSLAASHKIIRNMGYVFKKTLKASERGREDISKSREERRGFQSGVDARRLVFPDESGLKTNMTRLYGRAFKGSRCMDAAPCGHWETVTVLSSVRLDGTAESLVFEGAAGRKMFDAYVKEVLAPTPRPGDIVVMDNLSAHKSRMACGEIEKRQAEVKFLPAYSPNLNPIEKMRGKVKQLLRGMKARTEEELYDGTATALNAVSTRDARGWFESCGYILSQS